MFIGLKDKNTEPTLAFIKKSNLQKTVLLEFFSKKNYFLHVVLK